MIFTQQIIIKRVIIVLLILCGWGNLFAQKFSSETELFIEEFEDYVGKNLSGEDEELLEKFVDLWTVDSTYFTDEEKNEFVQTSNYMYKRRARPNPHFVLYIHAYISFKENFHDESSFQNWESGLNQMLTEGDVKLGELSKFLENTISLLNNKMLFESSSVQWKMSGHDFKFEHDKILKVIVPETDLICYAKRDSIHVFETSGWYEPVESVWHGEKALVTWERAGYNRNNVFARIPAYKIDMTGSDYHVDSVVFTHKQYFDYTLFGELTDKVRYNKTSDAADYPQFDSYQKNFDIENIYENVNYQGGLSMQGSKLVGKGTTDKSARLTILRNDTIILEASSNYFAFKEKRVNGIKTSVKIMIEEDSIFHPDLAFTYLVNNRELSLIRTDDFNSQSPYFNSYHKVDMNFEQLHWMVDESEIRFTMLPGSSIGNANFESINFFNYERFYKLQMRDPVHPLYAIKKFVQRYGSEEFPIMEFAHYMKRSIALVRQLMMRMSFQGFVFYDVNTEVVTVKQRLYDYLAASIGRIDYDVLDIKSTTNAPLDNAILNLKTNDLTINGVPSIFLSDSQAVSIFPRNEQIVMKRNRNFMFDGTIDAGLFTFHGDNFFFEYDSFKIELQNIDSLRMRYLDDEKDNFGNPLIGNVDTKIESLTGELLIDGADNKSGVKSYPEYPVFRSLENSYVYYDGLNIEEGVYSRESFFFELEPFALDSLDNFSKTGLAYDGVLYSGGIFPDMEETLRIQPDNSLGFVHETGEEGLPIYNGKADYVSVITLNNSGLRGGGTLKYLSSSTMSDDFKFYPDSTNADAQEFTIEKQTVATQFPQVRSNNNYIHFMPYEDELYAHQKTVPFSVVTDTSLLSGSLLLEPQGLSGNGKMDLKNSELVSDDFQYKAEEIFADTSDFYLKSLNSEGYTVISENVNSHIDYEQREGIFNSNEDFAMVEFPENKYIGFIEHYVWFMDRREIEMGEEGTKDKPFIARSEPGFDEKSLEGALYVSIDPQQDSLNFVSPVAYYDYKDNIIDATRVKYIDVADARIYPFEGNVQVEPNNRIKRLEKAEIIASRNSRYHLIHTAGIDIFGKYDYTGHGNYDYVDETGETQVIHFEEIKLDTAYHTVANGIIPEPEDFTLSPNYKYQGKVRLSANRKLLTFDGAVEIEHNCEDVAKQWLSFESEIDPDSIYIPVAMQPLNINNSKVYNGIMIASDSIHIFSTFFGHRKNYSDEYVINADGYLHYSKAEELYKISSRAKLDSFSIPGNYISFHRENCVHYGEGKLNLGVDLGQVKLMPVGNVRRNIPANTTTIEMMLGVDFFLGDKVQSIFATDLDSLPGEPVDLTGNLYKKSVAEVLGKEASEMFFYEMGLFGMAKETPPELNKTIVFNDLTMVWNDATNSYQSIGKIGVGNVGGIQVNKKYEGFVEIVKKRSGDLMDIYLKIDDRNYYYFGYTRGVLQTLTTNRQYLELIKDKKPKDRKLKVGRGGTPYQYMIATDRKKNMFLRRWRETLAAREEENIN
jgi:hypothetical protein